MNLTQQVEAAIVALPAINPKTLFEVYSKTSSVVPYDRFRMICIGLGMRVGTNVTDAREAAMNFDRLELLASEVLSYARRKKEFKFSEIVNDFGEPDFLKTVLSKIANSGKITRVKEGVYQFNS